MCAIESVYVGYSVFGNNGRAKFTCLRQRCPATISQPWFGFCSNSHPSLLFVIVDLIGDRQWKDCDGEDDDGVGDDDGAVGAEEFRGRTVGVDVSVWLHRGVFACVEEIAQGLPTTKYLGFPLKMLTLLRSFDLHVVLVFDGRRLPAKAATNEARKERRDGQREIGLRLLKEGRLADARKALIQTTAITTDMVKGLINVTRGFPIAKKLDRWRCSGGSGPGRRGRPHGPLRVGCSARPPSERSLTHPLDLKLLAELGFWIEGGHR